jgi:hypothetical protein
VKIAQKAPKGSVILAMLPDTGERYLTTILFEGINEGTDELVDSVFGILGSGVDVDAEVNRTRGKPWNPKDDAPRAHRR